VSRNHSTEKRLTALLAIIIVCVMGISGRLFFVQAVSAAKYDREAEQQRLCVLEIAPKRGTILDRNGNELAVNVMMDTIYATPYLIKDREKFVKKVAPVLNVDESKLLQRLTRQSGFAYLVRKTDSKTVQKIKEIVEEDNVKGIGFIKESKRYYPNEALGSHVIGFSGIDNHGLGGLELYYDNLLYGKAGGIVAERDANGEPIPQSVQQTYDAVDGANIRVSIDREIQYRVEMELEAAVKKCEAKSGSVIVMNPKTGEIYAMASVPYYNPNDLSTLNTDNQRNKPVTDLYEPGSTMKAVMATAALQEGLCEPSTEFYLEPTIKIADKRIGEAHERPAETFTFSEIVEKSSNVGMVKIGLLMEKDRIQKYLERFGFAEKSGVDFPGEAKGYYPKASNWSKLSLANIPFGQGLCTTQLLMTKSFATIANDGIPVKPRFLIEATDKSGEVIKRESAIEEKRIIDAEACAEMKTILENTVTKGTGKEAQVANYRVGGKTGTAQKARTDGRGYEKGRYIASFIGMAPIKDPKLVISVVLDEPKTSIYGGSVAAPVFSKVAEFSLRYLKVPPDNQ